MRGQKTGGRIAGTPNKRTLEVIERLAQLKCDPIDGMAKIAMDENTPLELRARMLAELAPYAYPKRRPLEESSGSPVIVNIRGIGPEPDTPLQFDSLKDTT